MHRQSLELEGVGAVVVVVVVWYGSTGPMSGPPLGETSGAIGHHGVHRHLSKTFRHFFKRFDKRWRRYNRPRVYRGQAPYLGTQEQDQEGHKSL